MEIRPASKNDIDILARIYAKYYADDFPLNLNNSAYFILAEKNNEILGAGWLQAIIEATIILNQDARPRDKFAALKALIDSGMQQTKIFGFDQMHAFPKDPRFAAILEKHFGFNPTTCLVKNG
jgi:hypothetical protein